MKIVLLAFLIIFNQVKLNYSGLERKGFGSVAKVGQFPHIVAIAYSSSSGRFTYASGSLITSKHVVTAGHAVKGEFQRFVIAGDNNLGVNEFAPSRESRSVKKITLHPQALNPDGSPNYNHDLGVVEVVESFTLSDKTKIIGLAENNLIGGEECLAMGFSTLGDKNPIAFLMFDRFKLDGKKCGDMNKSNEYCAYRSNKPWHAGDVGGGLIKANYKQSVLYGVAVGLASSDKAGVYVNVAPHVKWLHATTGIEYMPSGQDKLWRATLRILFLYMSSFFGQNIY